MISPVRLRRICRRLSMTILSWVEAFLEILRFYWWRAIITPFKRCDDDMFRYYHLLQTFDYITHTLYTRCVFRRTASYFDMATWWLQEWREIFLFEIFRKPARSVAYTSICFRHHEESIRRQKQFYAVMRVIAFRRYIFIEAITQYLWLYSDTMLFRDSSLLEFLAYVISTTKYYFDVILFIMLSHRHARWW